MPLSFTLNEDFSNSTIKLRDALATSDEISIRFDISTWLNTDSIDTATFTAYDESGNDVTSDVIDSDKSTFTNSVLKPWIKGGGANNKRYFVQMRASTSSSGETYTFILEFEAKNYGER